MHLRDFTFDHQLSVLYGYLKYFSDEIIHYKQTVPTLMKECTHVKTPIWDIDDNIIDEFPDILTI